MFESPVLDRLDDEDEDGGGGAAMMLALGRLSGVASADLHLDCYLIRCGYKVEVRLFCMCTPVRRKFGGVRGRDKVEEV